MSQVAADLPSSDYSLDGFLDGSVMLVQPRRGHRAGLDAALLQALVPADASGHAIDLGAGVGTVGFAAAARAQALLVTGVENDPELVACAKAALERSENAGFASRVRVVEADVTKLGEARQTSGLAYGTADFVLMNPPFDQPQRVTPSPDAGRRRAHLAEASALSAWMRSAAGLLKPGGQLGLIHRAAALPEVLRALASAFGDVTVIPVHPFAAKPARRILVQARKSGRGDLRLMPAVVLHNAAGGWTPEADAILRGTADLSRP